MGKEVTDTRLALMPTNQTQSTPTASHRHQYSHENEYSSESLLYPTRHQIHHFGNNSPQPTSNIKKTDNRKQESRKQRPSIKKAKQTARR